MDAGLLWLVREQNRSISWEAVKLQTFTDSSIISVVLKANIQPVMEDAESVRSEQWCPTRGLVSVLVMQMQYHKKAYVERKPDEPCSY